MAVQKIKRRAAGKWRASQESDELVFAICDRYFRQLRQSSGDAGADFGDAFSNNEEEFSGGAASSVADWIRKRDGRTDITREKVYPLFWEACHRGFLLLQPPPERRLEEKLTQRFNLKKHPGQIAVVNVSGESAAQHVTAAAADKVVELIDRVWNDKRAKYPDAPEKQAVHLGMGAGYATMLVAKRLAYKIRNGGEIPQLVLHSLSSGGFLPNEPHKSPSTYFTYFDPAVMDVKFVALFSATVVSAEDYAQQKSNPSIKYSFERRGEIDIFVTSLAAANHKHGLLGHYLESLILQDLLPQDLLLDLLDAGWIGDVQFLPYSAKGPLKDACKVRAMTLFELDELVTMASDPDNGKYIVLVAGPCGECGESKSHALLPLLDNPKLRLWTHLVTDARTAAELLEYPA